MNPYYATAFLGTLYFWVWPAFLYKSLAAPWALVLLVSAVLFLGVGRLVSEVHLRLIAPKQPPNGPLALVGAACTVIFVIAWATRYAYDAYAAAA